MLAYVYEDTGKFCMEEREKTKVAISDRCDCPRHISKHLFQ